MIQIYVMDISKLSKKDLYERAYALSDIRRQQKADALGTAAGKACCIGAGLLLSFALRQRGIVLKETELACNAYGKPFLKDYENLFFNLSHSGCMVACVVADVPCGIDIQLVQPCNLRLAHRFFTEDEGEALEQMPNKKERDLFFTSLFSGKESHAKRDGISAVQILGRRADKPYVQKVLPVGQEQYVLSVTI